MATLDTAAAEARIKKLIPSVGPRSPEHFHLDALFDEMPPPGDIVGICAALLEVAVKTLGSKADQIEALIVIPLRPSETFQPRPPGQKQLLEELADEEVEPASLYLMDRSAWALIVRQEEFRRPLPIPEFVRDDWFPEYRTMRRDPDDLFIRSIWVHHLPDSHAG